MFIQTEQTPNPATLKFIPGRPVLGDRTANFVDAAAAAVSPLARKLFEIEGVTGVFLGGNFITVTKAGGDWQGLKPIILGTIMEHFTSGEPILEAAAEADETMADNPDDLPVIDQIKELLDTRVRPAVARDGGDITYHGFRRGVVYLHMKGSCSGCPSSTATLKHGIENLLRHYIPEVSEVRAI